jgi:hypothetical protein
LEAQANKSGEVFSEGDSQKLVAVNKMIDDISHKLAIQEAERTQT